MFKRFWREWNYWPRRLFVYSQEVIMGLAWLAFAFIGTNATIITTLEVTYPAVGGLFHVAYAIAGILMLIAVAKPHLFFTAWVFSSIISFSSFMASIGVDHETNAVLYPVTWALFLAVSITQAVRHYWKDDIGT